MKRSARVGCAMVLVLIAGVISAGYPVIAVTQPVRVTPGSGDDLRAAYANASEVAEGKRLAEASCVGCHGANGISTTRGVPHLAGQRPGYLYLELRAYQSGARSDSAMEGAVKFLKDDALVKVAAYYASLDPAPPNATGGGKATTAVLDPVQAGKTAATACAGCHGEMGISRTPGTPSLAGLDPKYLVAAMKGYKGGQRKSEVMRSMLTAVPDADLSNVALYYALQKTARAQTPAAGDRAAGKTAAAACAGCHGDNGVSTNPTVPSLAGQDAQYLATALLAYKSGARSDETMTGMAVNLNEPAAKDLAAFYANQQPHAPDVRKPLTAAEWVQRCDRCHGVGGNSADPRLPALAAQRMDYLEKVLQAYRTGERKSPQMAAMSAVLTDADVEALAAYYARQKARAVVYVTLPSK